MKTSTFVLASMLVSSAAQAQVHVLAAARLDRTYHLTSMDCPLEKFKGARVAVALAKTKDDDIRRGCYEIDERARSVLIYWFEDDPKKRLPTSIPLSAFTTQ